MGDRFVGFPEHDPRGECAERREAGDGRHKRDQPRRVTTESLDEKKDWILEHNQRNHVDEARRQHQVRKIPDVDHISLVFVWCRTL